MPRVVITFISGRKIEEHNDTFKTAEEWKEDVLYNLDSLRDKRWIGINNIIVKISEIETISFYQT
jgi:hypothetical protein